MVPQPSGPSRRRPDGTLIAFNASAEPSPTQNIWTIRPDGSGLAQLTTYSQDG
jgi:Tol biopolymer transport system component